MSLEINLVPQQPILVVELVGDIDASTASQILEAVLAAVSPEMCHVALDMDGVSFTSSAGLRAILGILREVRGMGGDLRLGRLQPDVASVIQMGFSNMLKTYGTMPGLLNTYYDELGISAPVEAGDRWANADDFLDDMRLIGDPLADETVRKIFELGELASVNDLLRELYTNDHIPSASLPAAVKEYIQNSTDLPAWADYTRIRNAQAVFGRYGMHIGSILYTASLPLSYSAKKGVRVLGMTQRISKNVYKRIFETTQMVLDLMAPGGLDPQGYGLRSVQKVRLMHAGIRHHLMQSGEWDVEYYGYPINQEDLVGTLLTFSIVPITRLEMLGITLSEQEHEDFCHTWNVIGYMMGIVPELLPNGTQDHLSLHNKIMQRHAEPSEDGQLLTKNLLDMMHQDFPGGRLHEMPEALLRYFCGDEVADILGVPQTNWERALKPMQWSNRLIDKLDNNIPLIGKVSEIFIRRLMKAITTHELEGKRTDFRISASLRDDIDAVEEIPTE